MIKKAILDVTSHDYTIIKEKIVENIEDYYLNEQVHKMINNIVSNKMVNNIIIENPYYDIDYLSTYYYFYIKKHRKFKKECVRIHYFGEKNIYLGYMTLRPTVEKTNIGKTYLSPKLFLSENSRVITNPFSVHIFGYRTTINAFPWMQQETDITVCAHVAIWSVLRYFGTKYPNYHNITMGSVVEKLPEDIERKIPTSSVNMQKIPDIFKIMGFSPIVLSKNIVGKDRFEREMITYIDSGLPIVACMTEKNHAVSVIGYVRDCKEDIKKVLDGAEKLLYNSNVIKEIIVNDDNFCPYLHLRRRTNLNPFDDTLVFSQSERFIEDIDYLIVPLYDRMQYSYGSLYNTLRNFLKSNVFLEDDKKYIVKEYITSANSLKKHALIYIKNTDLRNTILKITMPRFVWCVDFISFDNYEQEMIFARILVDTTCCNRIKDPWLLFHNNSFIKFLDESEWKIIDTNIEPYKKFENLEEVI